jgi:hypothetical protein
MLRYIVIVPYRRNGKLKAVSYPGSNATYSRAEAVTALEKLHRGMLRDVETIPDELRPWAESTDESQRRLRLNGERFHLEEA